MFLDMLEGLGLHDVVVILWTLLTVHHVIDWSTTWSTVKTIFLWKAEDMIITSLDIRLSL